MKIMRPPHHKRFSINFPIQKTSTTYKPETQCKMYSNMIFISQVRENEEVKNRYLLFIHKFDHVKNNY